MTDSAERSIPPTSKPMTATQVNAIQEEALGLMRELNEYAQKHYRSQPRCTCDLMSICTRLYSALIKRLGSSSDETSEHLGWAEEERRCLLQYHDFHGRQMPDPEGAAHRHRADQLRGISNLSSGCHRSHPHENMDAGCERLTEIAREQNESAQKAGGES